MRTIFLDNWMLDRATRDPATQALLLGSSRFEVQPVLTLLSLFEIAQYDDHPWRESRIRLIETISPIYLKDSGHLKKEIAYESYWSSIGLPDRRQGRFWGSAAQALAGSGVSLKNPWASCGEIIEELRARPDKLHSLRSGCQEFVADENRYLRSVRPIDYIEYSRAFLRRYPPKATPAGLVIGRLDQDFSKFVGEFDWLSIPIFRLEAETWAIKSTWKRKKAQGSDLFDEQQVLPSLLLCDAVVADKRMKDLAKQLRSRVPELGMGQVFCAGDWAEMESWIHVGA